MDDRDEAKQPIEQRGKEHEKILEDLAREEWERGPRGRRPARLRAIADLLLAWERRPPQCLARPYVEVALRHAEASEQRRDRRFTERHPCEPQGLELSEGIGPEEVHLCKEMFTLLQERREAVAVAVILDADGASSQEIAEELKHRGYVNRNSGEITHVTVRQWLSRFRQEQRAA